MQTMSATSGGVDLNVAYQQLLSAVTTRGSSDDWYLLGCFLSDQKKWGAAAGCFARSVERSPDSFRAWCNWGWNLHLSGRHAEAYEKLKEAERRASYEATPHALLSQVCITLGKRDEAIAEARLAVEHGYEAVNHVALSFALMGDGQWVEGWSEYQFRVPYKIPEMLTRPFPLWDGSEGRRLFIEGEQGSGDCIMASRWLPECIRRAKEVVIYVDKPLYKLFSENFAGPAVRVYPTPQPFPDTDVWCPMMSLPVALGVSEAGPGGAYLHA